MITVKVLSKYIPPFPSIDWQYHWRFSFTFIVNEFSQRILPSYKDQLPDLHHNYSLVSIQGNSSRHLEDFLRHCQVLQRKIWTSHFALKGTRRSPMSTLCAMWYHLYYLQKPVKNTHGRVFLLVKLQAFKSWRLKETHFHGCFSRFFNCTNGSKSRKASHISISNSWF